MIQAFEEAARSRHGRFMICMMPRQSISQQDFIDHIPPNAIALDGVVKGGPYSDNKKRKVNFDHHDGVIREATMSTCKQVEFAIKGDFIGLFDPGSDIYILMNDTDQDSTLAAWLILRYLSFQGTASNENINRLITLTDRWDITAGSYPMVLSDELVRTHAWLFRPYTNLRKSGDLAKASGQVLLDNLEAMFARLDKYKMGQHELEELDKRHIILYQDEHFWMVDEIGGQDARYYLWQQGMRAYINIVARRPDGKMVVSIGRKSRHVNFPHIPIINAYNEAEGLTAENGWGGSDINGGSSRMLGTGLSIETMRDIAREQCAMA